MMDGVSGRTSVAEQPGQPGFGRVDPTILELGEVVRLAQLAERRMSEALDRLRRGEQGAADLVLAGWDCLALEEELIRRQAESALAEPAQDLLEVGLE